MRQVSLLVATLVLGACNDPKNDSNDDTPVDSPADTSPVLDDSTGEETGGGDSTGGESGGGDSTGEETGGHDTHESGGEDTEPPPMPDDLSASVHPVMESIVVLDWTQPEAGTIQAEYSVDEGEWLSSPAYEVEAGPRRLLLLGIPFETEVTWRLLIDGFPAADDASLATGALPAGVPEVDDVSGDAASWDPSVRWILGSLAGSGSGTSTWAFVLDRRGRVVWASATPSRRTTFSPMPSVDGTEILIDYNSWWGAFDGGAASEVARFDIEGTELGRWSTPGLIHPFTQLDDGRIAWSAAQGGSRYRGEVLAVQDDAGETVDLFDCNAFSASLGDEQCGSNTVSWNPADGHYLYSIYTLDTVFELDADGGVIRYFGHLTGAWDFGDEDTAFWWQHGTQYLPDGHLLVSTRVDETTEETVVREYALDEATETLEQVWSFGEGLGVYAPILGEPRRLPGGNTLHNYGSNPRIREATPEGEVVWDIAWDETGTLGCTHVVEDLYAMWGAEP